MLAQLPGGDGAGDTGFGRQEEGQLGPLDQSMRRAGLPRHELKRGNILRADLRLKHREGLGHGSPPLTRTKLYPFTDFIPTYEMDHLAPAIAWLQDARWVPLMLSQKLPML
jgi:hypothetical protein